MGLGLRGRGWTRGRRGVVLALLVAMGLIAGPSVPSVTAELPGIPEIPKIHIEPLAPGLPALPNPPYHAPLDPNPPPAAGQAHPRLLFSADDLPTIRERIADPTSNPGKAWLALKAAVDRRVPTDPILDRPNRRFGRQELADVGFVWLVTQDPEYLEMARGLILEIAATAPDYGAVPITDVASACCEYYNTRAHILNGLALAWDFLYNDLSAADRLVLSTALLTLGTEHFTHSLNAWWATVSTASNFTGNNGAAVGMAGMALYGDVPGPVPSLWLAKGRQLVASYAAAGFDSTGASLEGILYGNYGLRIPTLFGAALERAGADNPLRHANVRRQPRWTAYELLPGGGAVNPLNDARYHDLNPTHLTWATRYGADPDLAAWIWDHFVPINEKSPGGVGEAIPTMLWYEPPDVSFHPEQLLPLGQAFTGRGLVHTRTGWEAGDLMASFEARQNVWGEGIHHNQDVNSFTLYADGARLVIDSGYANWLERMVATEFEGARSSTTEAHNYILADGRGQDFFSTGRLRRAVTTSAVDAPGAFDVAVGDARLAYLIAPPLRADRYFVHVRDDAGGPGYILLGDVFRQDTAVRHYTSYLQTEPGNSITVLPSPSPSTARARFDAPNGAALDITMAGTSPLTAVPGSFTADYPEIGTHPRLGVVTDADAMQTITILAPTVAGRIAPTTTPVPAEGGTAVSVVQAERTDLVVLRTNPVGTVANRLPVGEARTAEVRTDGELAIVSVHPATGAVVRFVLAEGTQLHHRGERLVDVTGGPATVATSDTTVAVAGDRVTAFVVRAGAGLERVTLNGELVRVARCGADVVYPIRRC